tara:strand:- start:2193 stop:2639 length:447 start_codon:yes stop_codon:yes gene_type:complete
MVPPPELTQLRQDYIEASGNIELIESLSQDLMSVSKGDKNIYVAYKGAVLAMKAKYTKGKERKELFKEGAELIEFAVASDSDNIEIRVVRLSIQENVPKILRYHSSISEDKEFIKKNYQLVTSKSLKNFIKGYVLQSDGFTTAEKDLF